MKALKLLFVFLAFSAVTFYSCSDSDPVGTIVPPQASQESIALRTALNELKTAHNIEGRSGADSVFCFNFVYPITFTFSNGTNVTVTSFAGLLDILANESPQLYLESVVFPFQVTQEGTITTISNEGEFVTLLINCGIDTINDDLETTYCFDIIFPITIVEGGQNVVIDSQAEFLTHLTAAGNIETQIVFPISVYYNNQIVAINNLYEFYNVIGACDECEVCTFEYAPVCVQTATGIVEFGNMCFATCAGFTQNDLVSCNGSNDCSITNFTASTGTCDATGGTYPVTINFSYQNASAETFDVNINGTFYGTHPLSALPITFNVPQSPNAVSGSAYVRITGEDCDPETSFAIPSCNCICTTDYAPVCVNTSNQGTVTFSNACNALCAGYTQDQFVTCATTQPNFEHALSTCFTIQYPVQIQNGGQVITANDNGTVLQYWFPNQSPIPNFVYPITLTIASPAGPSTIIVNGGGALIEIVNNCN